MAFLSGFMNFSGLRALGISEGEVAEPSSRRVTVVRGSPTLRMHGLRKICSKERRRNDLNGVFLLLDFTYWLDTASLTQREQLDQLIVRASMRWA